MNDATMFHSLILAGAVSGLLAGLLGIGGGIILVPVLFSIFEGFGVSTATAMLLATGTSLLAIIPTSLSSIWCHALRRTIDWEIVKHWSPFIAFGVLVGVLFLQAAGGLVASTIFAVVSIAVALNMLLRNTPEATSTVMPAGHWQSLAATVIGAISSVMGINGGSFGVMLLTAWKHPLAQAIGTSAALGLAVAVPGAILMMVLGRTPEDAPPGTYGFVNLFAFASIAPATIALAPVGVWLNSRMSNRWLRKVFAVALIVSGVRMLVKVTAL